MITWLRALSKMLLIFLLAVFMLVLISIADIFYLKEAKRIQIVRFFVRKINKILGLKIHCRLDLEKIEQGLFVANHLSYLDIFIMYDSLSCVFISSEEMRDSYILGDIVKKAGCLFVNRKSIWSLKKEISEMSDKLKNGLNVTFFPEATTSDGTVLLPFRSSLFEAAKQAHKKVYPIALRYIAVDGEHINHLNKDTVYWYSDMTFFSHIFLLCSHTSVEVEMNLLPELNWNQFMDRKIMAKKAYHQVKSQMTYLPPEKSIVEKLKDFYGDRVYFPQ